MEKYLFSDYSKLRIDIVKEYETLLFDCKIEFGEKLNDVYNEACEKIAFQEIEYKKTITKKRKEHNRKNGKNAKPQRVWRYIDEE